MATRARQLDTEITRYNEPTDSYPTDQRRARADKAARLADDVSSMIADVLASMPEDDSLREIDFRPTDPEIAWWHRARKALETAHHCLTTLAPTDDPDLCNASPYGLAMPFEYRAIDIDDFPEEARVEGLADYSWHENWQLTRSKLREGADKWAEGVWRMNQSRVVALVRDMHADHLEILEARKKESPTPSATAAAHAHA